MGTANAGFVYRPAAPIDDISSLIVKLFGKEAIRIDRPDYRDFDIRNSTDVVVEVYGDVYFVSNSALVWDILEDTSIEATAIYEALDKPELILCFCNFDSGGSYGYAFIEQGKRTRSRLEMVPADHRPSIIEYGEPKKFELDWFSADFFLHEDSGPVEERLKIFYKKNPEIQVPECLITNQLVREAMDLAFGVCPWITMDRSICYFFRLPNEDHLQRNNMTAKVYTGIAASLPDRENVIELHIEAREADDFFYWASSSEKSALKLKAHFPNLKKVIIEDDYLIQSQIDALSIHLLPLEVKWKVCGYIDGRHGR